MTLGVKPKKRPSGAARRKQKKERAIAAHKAKLVSDDALTPQSYDEAPYTYDEWRREGREVYWDIRKGRLDMDSGRTLTWAAELNARMANMAEELVYQRELVRLLSEPRGLQPMLMREQIRGAINGEVVESKVNGHE